MLEDVLELNLKPVIAIAMVTIMELQYRQASFNLVCSAYYRAAQMKGGEKYMKKLTILSLLAVFGLFGVVAPASAAVVVRTSGNANVSVKSTVTSSSSNVVTKNCSFTYTISSNGGGTNTVTGGTCTCQ